MSTMASCGDFIIILSIKEKLGVHLFTFSLSISIFNYFLFNNNLSYTIFAESKYT